MKGSIGKRLLVLLLVASLTALASPDLRGLKNRSSLLDSLTAQIHQLFLQSDEKLKEAETRMAEAPFMCQGRLTTESGVPISTSDRASQSTIYFTPYQGSRVAVYNGTNWILYTFSELSLSLSGMTAGNNYDIFIYYNIGGGTLALELGSAWTNNTTRATALTKQDGVYVLSGSTTRRYLGTIRAISATQIDDTMARRFLWNYYNRTRRTLGFDITTDSWTYGSAAFRAVANDTNFRVQYVVGDSEVPVHLRGMMVSSGTQAVTNYGLSLGLDTTTNTDTLVPRGGAGNTMIRQQMWTEVTEDAYGLGFHYYQAVEYGDNTAVNYGDAAGDARVQSGVLGWLEG